MSVLSSEMADIRVLVLARIYNITCMHCAEQNNNTVNVYVGLGLWPLYQFWPLCVAGRSFVYLTDAGHRQILKTITIIFQQYEGFCIWRINIYRIFCTIIIFVCVCLRMLFTENVAPKPTPALFKYITIVIIHDENGINT